MTAVATRSRFARLIWLLFLPVLLCSATASADVVMRADQPELAVGASTMIHLEGNSRWLKARWSAEPEGRVRFDSKRNTQATITALQPGPVSIVAKVLTRRYSLTLVVADSTPLAERPGGPVRVEGLARVLGLSDQGARIARMLTEVKAGTRAPRDFYGDLARMGANMFDVMRVRSRLVDGDPVLAREVMGETYASGGTPVEKALLVWRREQTKAAIEDVVERFRKAGRGPADGNALIISRVGKWADQVPEALTFTGDIDFSFVSNDVALAEAMKAAFDELIQVRTGLDPTSLDSVATAHGKARLEVYIGRHGMAFAEEQMKNNDLVDMKTGGTWEIQLGDVARILTVERELAEARGVEPIRPATDTEPGLSMEMVRHFEHDIVKPKLFDMANAVIKAAKYLDRSYQSMTTSGGHPGDPRLAAFAREITAWANAKPFTAEIREKMVRRISDYLDSPPRVVFDQNSQKLVLALRPERIAAFHKQAAEAMWDTVAQGSGKRTREMETRLRELEERRRQGGDVEEAVAALRRDMVGLVDMVEAEVKAMHGEPVPQVVLDNNARVRGLLERLASHHATRVLSEEELTDKRWVEALLEAERQHPSKLRRELTAAYVMERGLETLKNSPELAMRGVEKGNQILDYVDDKLLGGLRGESGFNNFEAEMHAIRVAAADPATRASAMKRLDLLKGRVALHVQNANQRINEALQDTAAGRQGMKFMMVYGLVDEMKSYRDAYAREGWGGFATEMFRRRIPFGSAVENVVMGNTLRAGWDVITTLVPPLGLPEAAAGVATSTYEQVEAGYWNEQLALFVDSLYQSARFELDRTRDYGTAQVERYRLVSVTYRDQTIDLARFAAMRNEQLAELRRQIGHGHLDWAAYDREFKGLTRWLEVDRILANNLAAADPVLALLEEMQQHPAVGARLTGRLLEQYEVRWVAVKLGFIVNLIERLENRGQADQSLAEGEMSGLYEELRRIAAELGIETEMLAGLDAEVDTNHMKQLINWFWEKKRHLLDQPPTQSEAGRASEVVLRYLESYTDIRAARAKALDSLSERAYKDGPHHYLTGPLFFSGHPKADQAAVTTWSRHVRETWDVAVADTMAVKREVLGRDDLEFEDRDFAVRYAIETLWIKPYRQAGLAAGDADLNGRASEHGLARQRVLKEYRDWLLSVPVMLQVTLDTPSGEPDSEGLVAELKPDMPTAAAVPGQGSGGRIEFQAPAGRYRLSIRAPGYEDHGQDVELDRRQGDVISLNVKLMPRSASGRSGAATPTPKTATPPFDPDAREFVLDRVEFAKAPERGDLCGDTPTCIHSRRVASGEVIEHRYEIGPKQAGYAFKATRQSNGEVLSDYGVNITFASPPASIRAGQKLPLTASGAVRGYTTGMYLKRGFTYYIEHHGNKNYWKQTMLSFLNRDMPLVNGRLRGPLRDEKITEITIPKDARKEVILGGRAGWDPPLFIIWVYKERFRPASAFPAPTRGEYTCNGGWGTVLITDSAPGHARGTYTGTYDKSAPGWIELRAREGEWQGDWGEDKVGRKGAIQYLKLSGEAFSGRWWVPKESPGSHAGKKLPRGSGRLQCTLKQAHK